LEYSSHVVLSEDIVRMYRSWTKVVG
jgi:hypothetical protein